MPEPPTPSRFYTARAPFLGKPRQEGVRVGATLEPRLGLISAMYDLAMLAIGIAAFAVTILYVFACERL
jgi:hypothetical protein